MRTLQIWKDSFLSKSIPATFNLLRSIQATPREIEQVMGYLKYKPESWVVLQDNSHFWYDKAKLAASSLLRNELPEDDLTILVHLESRWLLLLSKGDVIPAIFLFTDESRDGLSVSFYRIMTLNSEWNDEFRRLMLKVVLFSVKNEENEVKPLPMDEYRLQI